MLAQVLSISTHVLGPMSRLYCTHCANCSMPKGTCWAELITNGEKIKPATLADVKLCLSEEIVTWSSCLLFIPVFDIGTRLTKEPVCVSTKLKGCKMKHM